MITEWAIAELDKFIAQTVMTNASGGNVVTYRNRTAASDADVTRQAQIVEKIFDRVVPDWRSEIANSKSNRWTRHREAAIRAREQLVREQEVKENLGENAPELSAAESSPVGLERREVAVAVRSLPRGGRGRDQEAERRDAEQNRKARRERDRSVQAGVHVLTRRRREAATPPDAKRYK